MDLSILTTFFCLILLVLIVVALNELMILKRKINAHLDRTDLHSDKLHTILSILQQIEAKQDLIFNNAPPSPGEPQYSARSSLLEDWSKCAWQNAVGAPEPILDNADMDRAVEKFTHVPVPGHFTLTEPVFPDAWGKVSTTVPTKKKPNVLEPKKRGRPKKAPLELKPQKAPRPK